MEALIWLRAEHKPYERRTALSPGDAGSLLNAGISVAVESSSDRIFPDRAYQAQGCRIVPARSWRQAPPEAFILGLKELPRNTEPLRHRHIYFAHAYKHQAGWRQVLSRFALGGGSIYDLEYLVDENNRRVAAFGYWAGFVGAALALDRWCHQLINGAASIYPSVRPFTSSSALIKRLEGRLARALSTGDGSTPKALVIGALGRCGTGARELFGKLNLDVTGWDMAETAAGGPFRDILDFDMMVNAVLLSGSMPPFLTRELIAEPQRRLSVMCDVSCDPTSPNNPLPIYERITSLDEPSVRLLEPTDETRAPLDLIAIDHLPTLLPRESSLAFSKKLLPHLLRLPENTAVWTRALDLFHQKLEELRDDS